jgi:hypothetical protein
MGWILVTEAKKAEIDAKIKLTTQCPATDNMTSYTKKYMISFTTKMSPHALCTN